MIELGKNVTPSKAVKRTLTRVLGPPMVVRRFDRQGGGGSSGSIADFLVVDLVVFGTLASWTVTGLCGVTAVSFSSCSISSAGSRVESCGLQALAYVTSL